LALYITPAAFISRGIQWQHQKGRGHHGVVLLWQDWRQIEEATTNEKGKG